MDNTENDELKVLSFNDIVKNYLHEEQADKFLEEEPTLGKHVQEFEGSGNENNDDLPEESRTTIGDYFFLTDDMDFGFHQYKGKSSIRLTNFLIELTQWVKTTRNGEAVSYYSGEIAFSETDIQKFVKLPANLFADASSFQKYLENICGPKAIIYGSAREALKAIKTFNQDVIKVEELEFGFNQSLSEYNTGDLNITALGIQETDTPIRYSEKWGNNQLGFLQASEEEIETQKEFIRETLLPWSDAMKFALAFSFYPVIYPYLKKRNFNKFYLMLRGTSGSGKSQMSKWLQQFYGQFNSLFAWTSTGTAINVTGMAFKDALFVLDDLKLQNFRSERDVNHAMAVIQNYSDGTSRQRSKVDLSLMDEKYIQGHLLINGEDLIFTEASTIARGIIIDLESKEVEFEKLNEISKASEKFSAILPHFIQYVMKYYSRDRIEKIFDAAHKFISKHPLIDEVGVSQDNLPRMINNFAALKTAWEIFSEFIATDEPLSEFQSSKNNFDSELISLLRDNIDRIAKLKQEVLLEQNLFELIEDGTFRLEKVLSNGEAEFPNIADRGKKVGAYTINSKGEYKVVIQLSTAIREMRKILPQLKSSEDTIKTKLIQDGKITLPPSKKCSLNGKKFSGVYWIADIPQNILGLRESEDPVDQAHEILFGSPVTKDDDSDNLIF